MSQKPAITAVIINYKTAELTLRAAGSFQKYYPDVSLLLIDNGSYDESIDLLKAFQQRSPAHTEIIVNNRNLHHGPAMDQALHIVHSPFVFFLDSDCEIHAGGFLERMVALLEEQDCSYAVGKRVFMNKRGFDVPAQGTAIPYIRPMFMLLKREHYMTLPPFFHHGTPCLANMQGAGNRGLQLIDFPVNDFVTHDGRGTAGRYGYGLGWRGKLNFLLNKVGL